MVVAPEYRTYHVPVEGRNTETSVPPSPSKSAGTPRVVNDRTVEDAINDGLTAVAFITRKDFSFPKLARWLTRAAEDARQSGALRLTVVPPAHAETSGPAAARVLRDEQAGYQPQQVLGRVEGPQRLVDVRDGGQRLVRVAGLAHGYLGQVEVGGREHSRQPPRFAGYQGYFIGFGLVAQGPKAHLVATRR